MKNKTNAISEKQLAEMSKDFNSDRANLIAASAAVKSGIMEASTDYSKAAEFPFTFNIDLKQGKITDQKASGRCWIFSALNTFRYEIIKKYSNGIKKHHFYHLLHLFLLIVGKKIIFYLDKASIFWY